jgi:hypothetical protein
MVWFAGGLSVFALWCSCRTSKRRGAIRKFGRNRIEISKARAFWCLGQTEKLYSRRSSGSDSTAEEIRIGIVGLHCARNGQ